MKVGVNTVNISKNIIENIGFGNSGLKYRQSCYGLNIKSICKNNNCTAYKDTIYIKIGFVRGWNLLENLKEKVICPMCNRRVSPLNFGFTNCNYEIEYEIYVKDGYENGNINGRAEKSDFKIFNEEKSGKANFTYLIFTVIPL